MELNYFRDRLFDLLNDSEGMGIADLNADERNSLLTVRTEDGNVFEIVCRQAAGKEDGWTTANWLYAMDVAITSNLRRRFFYKVSGWNRLDSPQGTKSPWNASRGSLSSQKTEQEQIQQNNVYDTMIFSENLFPLESDCGIMKLSTNRDREVNLYEWFCYSFS